MSNIKNNPKKIDDSKFNEETFINKFAFSLYQHGHLDNEWKISKFVMNQKFSEFCKENNIINKYGTNVEQILREYKILHYYRNQHFYLKYCKLFEYEDSILEKLDQDQIKLKGDTSLSQQITDQKIDDFNVDENAKIYEIQNEHSYRTLKNFDFVQRPFATCYICQKNYSSIDDFQEHIHVHNEISDFKWLEITPSNSESYFELFYQICKNPVFLKFNLKFLDSDIKIQRVITVKSSSIETLCKFDTEKKFENNLVSFVVDRHIFNKETTQPIVIIYEKKFSNVCVFMEHFLMCIDDLPILHSSYLTGYMSKRVPRGTTLKKSAEKLKEFFPDKILKALCSKNNSTIQDIVYLNPKVADYYRNGCQLTETNSGEVLNFLLQLDDIETEINYNQLYQKEAEIKGFGRDFSVKLNLKEQLNVEETIRAGDDIILKVKQNGTTLTEEEIQNKNNKNKKDKTTFYGIVNKIYGKTVCFEMRNDNVASKINKSLKYEVRFHPNRCNFIYQYYAIEQLKNDCLLQKFLFPQPQWESCPAYLSFKAINESIAKNPEQKQAVMNIVEGVTGLPYIIFGPPGTGKTTTIAESILQVKLHKSVRILVTASSNAACDEVAKRLLKLIEKNDRIKHIKVLRLYAKAVERKFDNIDEDLIEASNLAHGDHFYPSLDIIGTYDVVICTLSILGRLKSCDMPATFFQYIFIDECAASTETEALLGVAAVFHSRINVIIAGDPKQLGPIVSSKKANNLGLSNSLMERLLKLECYKVNTDKTYNRRIQTRLIRNFRTHPDILDVPNRLFYSGDLVPSAPKELTHWATNWYCLPEKKIPLIFDNASGHTKKDRFSTSLYNSRECDIVLSYVKRMLYFEKINGREITQEDIGIISPYKKQNLIIREELDKRGWYKIGTGSVETFQGQEKPIIIISTVRSVRSEKKGCGFLDDEKRLNVMLTRAQALLIIVGNLELLQTIPIWNEALQNYKSKNVITRSFYFTKNNANTKSVNSLAKSLDNLTVNDSKSKTKTRSKRRSRRSRSSQKSVQTSTQKVSDNNENDYFDKWINENKNLNSISLIKPNVRQNISNYEDDLDTISIIPEPIKAEIFNSSGSKYSMTNDINKNNNYNGRYYLGDTTNMKRVAAVAPTVTNSNISYKTRSSNLKKEKSVSPKKTTCNVC